MEKDLARLGFTKNESKIYLELLSSPHQTAGQISKKIGINRRSVYDSIARLLEKGYLGYNISSNKKFFFSVSPRAIKENIKEMEEIADDLLPKLENLPEKEEGNVVVYRGRKGIRNILNLVLESKEYMSLGTTEQFPIMMKHDFEVFQRKKKELKIKTRTILSKSIKNSEFIGISKPSTSFRFLSDNLSGPTSTFIFNNRVAIFIWDEPLFCILIESKNVYDSYGQYFEEMWKVAKL